jgi:uncharacterized protein (TIGR03083 family)
MDALAELDSATAAFARSLAGSSPSARLAAIDWSVEQLAAHLGGVHRWAALHTSRQTREERDNVPSLSVPMVEWYVESRTILLDTLRQRDPDTTCYTISITDKTVRFWHRRQLHETLVHLWDLESATEPRARASAEFAPEVYVDGVNELFEVFQRRVRNIQEFPLPGTLRLEATDADASWTFAEDWSTDAAAEPTSIVRGAAGDLLLFVWNRLDPAAQGSRLAVDGDEAVVAAFRAAPIRP